MLGIDRTLGGRSRVTTRRGQTRDMKESIADLSMEGPVGAKHGVGIRKGLRMQTARVGSDTLGRIAAFNLLRLTKRLFRLDLDTSKSLGLSICLHPISI